MEKKKLTLSGKRVQTREEDGEKSKPYRKREKRMASGRMIWKEVMFRNYVPRRSSES